MGNPLFDPLPIDALRPVIELAVQNHRVVVIQSETGSGKSTRVPQFLLSCAPQVVVTQPRRIAAASIAKRVAEEMGVELGSTVGYRTAGNAKVSSDTKLIFCTDGLEVLRQIFEVESHEGAIVVIDEAHEWSLNLELLIAWFKHKLTLGLDIRLVIMSATIEAELLASYFDDVDIVSSKGRTYPITEIAPMGDAVRSAKMLLEQECNVLVFMPGKAEIKRFIHRLYGWKVNAEILPLHADLSIEEQDRCFRAYDRPKCIVATNVAQTSITVPDIDAVVDCGTERRPAIVDGVEGLYIRPISIADRDQRKGRAGRVRPGMYIDCCPVPLAERKMFPTPAILTQGLEGMVLQLAQAGLQPEQLKFFHKPPEGQIESARQLLKKLRCLDSEDQVTEIGKLVSLLPMSVRYARMVAETYHRRGKYSYIDGESLLLACILEEGGVLNRKSDKWKEHIAPSKEAPVSDATEELVAFETARSMAIDNLAEVGIDDVAFERVRDSYQRVIAVLRSRKIWFSRGSSSKVQRAMAAGFADQLYRRSLVRDNYLRVESGSTPRNLPDESVVRGAEFVVGIPWNFQVMTDLGPKTKRLLRAATEVAPELVRQVSG